MENKYEYFKYFMLGIVIFFSIFMLCKKYYNENNYMNNGDYKLDIIEKVF